MDRYNMSRFQFYKKRLMNLGGNRDIVRYLPLPSLPRQPVCTRNDVTQQISRWPLWRSSRIVQQVIGSFKHGLDAKLIRGGNIREHDVRVGGKRDWLLWRCSNAFKLDLAMIQSKTNSYDCDVTWSESWTRSTVHRKVKFTSQASTWILSGIMLC